MGEWFLRSEASRRDVPIEVGSSGFLRNGEPASDAVMTVMAERGLQVAAHRSRISTPRIVRAADLVVTMEGRHARDITAMGTGVAVCTLPRAVELLSSIAVEGDDPRARLAGLAAALGPAGLEETADEVDDPFGRGLEVNRATADRLSFLSDRLLTALFPERQ